MQHRKYRCSHHRGTYAKIKDPEPDPKPEIDEEIFMKNYLESIKLLSETAKKEIGFEPLVITGPKTEAKIYDHIFYDNNHRRLYLIRDKVKDKEADFNTIQSFLPSEIEERKKNWKPGEWEIEKKD